MPPQSMTFQKGAVTLASMFRFAAPCASLMPSPATLLRASGGQCGASVGGAALGRSPVPRRDTGGRNCPGARGVGKGAAASSGRSEADRTPLGPASRLDAGVSPGCRNEAPGIQGGAPSFSLGGSRSPPPPDATRRRRGFASASPVNTQNPRTPARPSASSLPTVGSRPERRFREPLWWGPRSRFSVSAGEGGRERNGPGHSGGPRFRRP